MVFKFINQVYLQFIMHIVSVFINKLKFKLTLIKSSLENMSRKRDENIYQQVNDQTKVKASKSNGDKRDPNRMSANYQVGYTPQQIKGPNYIKGSRGNSQPPSSNDYKNAMPRAEDGSHSNKKASRKNDIKHFEYQQIEEAQKIRDRKERERLLQQYTINQPTGMTVPRNISAFQQQVKFPIQQSQHTHNFVMNQTHNEGGFGSPNKHHSKNRRQVVMSPNLNPYSSAQIHGIDAPINSMSMDHHKNFKSNHTAEKPYSGSKGEYEQISGFNNNRQDQSGSRISGSGRTKTILTTLGVEQQHVQINNKKPVSLNQGQYENLYQAQLNGQIKAYDQAQAAKIYQTQKNQDAQRHGLKFEQNFFKGPSLPTSSQGGSNASSFLPSIDNSYRVVQPGENMVPGTPNGKKHSKDHDYIIHSKNLKKQQVEHLKLKIGDTTADLHITINGGNDDDKTPRGHRKQKQNKNHKKDNNAVNNKSANQQMRTKPQPVNQPQASGNRANTKDRQLEDLNETLQRLAREKAEASHGKNGKIQTVQRKAVRQQYIQENQVPGYQMIEKEYFQDEADLRRRHRKQQSGDQSYTHKYKMEKNQRVQLIMGDGNMLISQRLQGVKQTAPSSSPSPAIQAENPPKSLMEQNMQSAAAKQQQQNQQNAPKTVQHIGQKVIKIQKNDIVLKKKNTEATVDNDNSLEMFSPKDRDASQQQIQQHATNLRINHAKVRNIIVDSSAPPSFGPDAGNSSQELQKPGESSLNIPQRNISHNSNIKQQEDRFSIVDHSKQKQLENSRAHFQNKRSMENPIIPNLYLHTENRFSSVIEDVENEQMKSPTTRGSKLSLKQQQQKIQQKEQKEKHDKEPVRASQDNPLRGENKMKVIQFLGHKRRKSNDGQQRVELEDFTRNNMQQPRQTNTFSIPSQSQINAEQLMESRDDLDEDPSLFRTRQGIVISSLELKERQINDNETPDGSRSRRQYEAKKSPNRETNYSQVFNLQSARLEQNKQHDPSATLGREVLASALKPPPGPLRPSPKKQMLTQRNAADNKRYSSNIATKRQSNTQLDLEPHSPTAHSNGSAEQRKNQLADYAQKVLPENRAEKQARKKQSSRINQLRDSKESNKSGPHKEQALAPAQRAHQIYTPRVALSGSVGDPIERVSGKFGVSQSPQARGPTQARGENGQAPHNQTVMVAHNTKRNQQKLQSQQAEDDDLANGLASKVDNSYLPHIDHRSTSKSPIRGAGALKPPVAPQTQRVESVTHAAQKLNNLNIQKSGKRRQQIQSPQKTQKGPILTKFETEPDDSSEGNDKIKALRLGVPVKTKKDNCSHCQEYCQYRGVQIPKKWRELFTHNRFRKSEGGQVWSQRLFMSKECAQSEDRRMMPILIINLDGAMGFWDDTVKNHYVLRQKAFESLITLSHDFRLVAISSQQQKLIFKLIHGLMNMPATDDQGHIDTNQLRHLYFDAVYQLQSTNEDRKFQSTQKNIDCIHFDLTQVLLDMQFKRQKSASKKEEQIEPEGANDENFLTFWESEQYRPYQKVLIFTTEQYLNKNHCYSFDYNYLFQASKFNNEQSKKSPVVIQLPHLRVNPKISFDVVHQLIFTLQYISHAIHLETQANHLIINGKLFENPEISSFEVCKKLLSSKWRQLESKMKHNANPKGLRVFDSDNDPYVNLENINFSESYKFLKKYFAQKSSNWLRIQKYYLKPRPSKQDKIQKMKLIAKVTFNDSPEIIRMGEDNGSQITKAVGTTHDSSKAESIKESKTTMYMSDDAKNLYNGLMIRNFKLQQEINSYARHHRIQNQAKQAHLKLMENKNEAAQRPIVIFDGDKEQEKPRSSLKQYTNTKSSIREGESKDKIAAIPAPAKAYSFKYRALIIKSGEIYEQWQTNDCDFSKYQTVNLRVKVNQASFERCIAGAPATPGVAQHPFPAQQQLAIQNTPRVALEKPSKTSLLDYLCKRQTRISYTTSQEMHLKNNLSQLVEGKQQYADQQKNLAEQDKEGGAQQLPNINEKDNKMESYLDGL